MSYAISACFLCDPFRYVKSVRCQTLEVGLHWRQGKLTMQPNAELPGIAVILKNIFLLNLVIFHFCWYNLSYKRIMVKSFLNR
jgi:hypothetical protein